VLSNFGLISLACGCLITVGAAVRVWAEERLVVRTYPEYRNYAARTRRFVPFVF